MRSRPMANVTRRSAVSRPGSGRSKSSVRRCATVPAMCLSLHHGKPSTTGARGLSPGSQPVMDPQATLSLSNSHLVGTIPRAAPTNPLPDSRVRGTLKAFRQVQSLRGGPAMGQRHIGIGRSARLRGADMHYARLSETANSYAKARLPAPQDAEVPCCFALNGGACLSSFRQRQSGRGQRVAEIWHGNGKPGQSGCVSSSRQRRTMPNGSVAAPATRDLPIWSGCWPGKPPEISWNVKPKRRGGRIASCRGSTP